MTPKTCHSTAAGGDPRRLFSFNGGLLRGRIAHILTLAGWCPKLGWPGAGDAVGIWGNSPTAWRGRAVAARTGAALVTVEDAFLRSVLPGRAKGAGGPLGLIVDPYGVHFDPSRPSLIERLVDQGADEARARAGIARLRTADLSKYNSHTATAPPAGYVLVIDQTQGDASLMGAGRAIFLRMLHAARAENPGLPLLIRSHPETAAGLRPGHFTPADLHPGEAFCDAPISPWRLVEGAAQVYAVSSQLGYEAMLAGHRPRLFGQPFYAGWGLSGDESALPRRGRASIEALFTASHLRAPIWYNPARDRLCSFEDAVDQLEAEVRAWREDHGGHLAYGMRLWKRPALARAFRPVRFTRTPGPAVTLAWANRAEGCPNARRVEDGFLRSRGLGAALVPPLSLVADDLGIYYDPNHESRLERIIAEGPPPGGEARAAALIARMLELGLSKYNLGTTLPGLPADLPSGRRILIPGQVEDDASIRLGAGKEKTNLALLERARAENPSAVLIYKPHPDVEAGLRPGVIPPERLKDLADAVIRGVDAAAALRGVDELWTITSTMGFEALLRGLPVTTLGAPFYAGWGLTRDLGPVPARRRARPSVEAFAHAALIAYPRYFNPKTGLPCAPEAAIEYLAAAAVQPPGLRMLAKAQGLLASQSWLWR